MKSQKQEKKIEKSIIILPIISIVLLSSIIFVSFSVYIKTFQKEQLKDLTANFIKKKKEISKSRIYDLEKDIKINIKHLKKSIKKRLKGRLNEASEIIDSIINAHPKKDKRKIEDEIVAILSSIRYNNGRGYYFAFDKDSNITLIHPLKKYLHKNMRYLKDKKGTPITQEMLKIANKKGEGFLTFYFAKPDQPNKEFKKIVYIRYFPKLNWIIGTGEYIKDAEKELQNNILEKIENKKFGDNGYFWVHSIKGRLLAHPYRKKSIGRNDLDLKDAKGNFIIKMFIDEALKHPEGAFVKYYWENPATKKVEEKISFIKEFKEWGWILGTGVYLTDIRNLIGNSTKKFNSKIDKLYSYIGLIIFISLLLTISLSLFLSKQTKKVFKIYREDLENRIEKAIQENKEKDKMLQQQSKLASMGEMMENIAHQWRQPLNALGINIQNLEDDYEDGLIDNKFLNNFVNKNMQIIRYMSNTIDDFRNFFKIDKVKSKFNIEETIRQVLTIQSATLKNQGIEVEIQGKDFTVNGYESEFKQVVLNIINNAKDAIKEKQIKNGKISITIDKPYVIIEDNAGGIPQEIIDRVFEPYFTTKEQGKGTGIGLYMSKMIIEQNMNGMLSVENTPTGAKFKIKLEDDSENDSASVNQ